MAWWDNIFGMLLEGSRKDFVSVAQRELGVKEVPGKGSNLRVEEYHKVTAAGAAKDNVPWCSSFVCFVVEKFGLVSTRSKSALSWLKWGAPCGPEYGCIAVIRYTATRGHVGILVGQSADSKRWVLLGGNQNDKVCYKSYDKKLFAGFRKAPGDALPAVRIAKNGMTLV